MHHLAVDKTIAAAIQACRSPLTNAVKTWSNVDRFQVQDAIEDDEQMRLSAAWQYLRMMHPS